MFASAPRARAPPQKDYSIAVTKAPTAADLVALSGTPQPGVDTTNAQTGSSLVPGGITLPAPTLTIYLTGGSVITEGTYTAAIAPAAPAHHRRRQLLDSKEGKDSKEGGDGKKSSSKDSEGQKPKPAVPGSLPNIVVPALITSDGAFRSAITPASDLVTPCSGTYTLTFRWGIGRAGEQRKRSREGKKRARCAHLLERARQAQACTHMCTCILPTLHSGSQTAP